MPAVLPQPIADLHLMQAFQGYAMPINQCIKSASDKIILVADKEQEHYSDFVTPNSIEYLLGKVLTIHNEQLKEVVLIQIDNKLISSSSSQPRCDCAIADKEIFRFVEFKTNALGNTDSAYSQTYETAMKQLSKSIQLFADKTQQIGFPLKDRRKLSAHICTSLRFPRIQTSEIAYAVKFGLQEHLPLYFENEITI